MRGPLLFGGVAVLALGGLALRTEGIGRRWLPPAHSSRVEVRPSPNVVLAIRELARLETVTFHMERVVELSDQQTHLFGLIEARDALLLIAVGEVVAGVDLSRLREGDVQTEWPTRRVQLRLPAPEVFSTTIDNAQTRVHTRSTDRLAARREDLEERARREAESTMRRGAIEGGILTRARTSAERAVSSLLHSLGFELVQIEWHGPRGGDALD